MPEDNTPTPTPVNAAPIIPSQDEGKKRSLLKGRAPLFLAIGGTVVLAGIAVFTAIRLYQLRSQRVAPTAPEEQAQAQAPTSTPTPTLRPTSTPTPTGSGTGTPTPTSRLSPTLTPRLSPTASVSATPTTKLTITPTKATLPDAGVSFPTIVGVSTGLLLVIASVLLAL